MMAKWTLLASVLLALAVGITAIDWDANCTEGDQWKDDCHTCRCANGRPVCSRELCLSEAGKSATQSAEATSNQPTCKENEQWKEDCRSCRCTNGKPLCTEKLCPGDALKSKVEPSKLTILKRNVEPSKPTTLRLPKPTSTEQPSSEEEDTSCTPGAEWVEDCNNCICDHFGEPECTRRLCAP